MTTGNDIEGDRVPETPDSAGGEGGGRERGSLEGRLAATAERGRTRFVLYEDLWNRPIECFVPERLVGEATAALGRRVELYGFVEYRADGDPVGIEVEEVVLFPPAADIPSFRDVYGIPGRTS